MRRICSQSPTRAASVAPVTRAAYPANGLPKTHAHKGSGKGEKNKPRIRLEAAGLVCVLFFVFFSFWLKATMSALVLAPHFSAVLEYHGILTMRKRESDLFKNRQRTAGASLSAAHR